MSIDFQERCPNHDAVLAVEYVGYRVRPNNMPDKTVVLIYKKLTCPKDNNYNRCEESRLISNIRQFQGNGFRFVDEWSNPVFREKIIILNTMALSQFKPMIEENK